MRSVIADIKPLAVYALYLGNHDYSLAGENEPFRAAFSVQELPLEGILRVQEERGARIEIKIILDCIGSQPKMD